MKNTFVKSICILTGCLLLSQDGNTPTNLQIDAASVGGVTLSWDVPENYQKHENFHTFEQQLMKRLVVLTLYDGQAGMSTPKDCRDGARKRLKTRDFSHIPARKYKKNTILFAHLGRDV